MLIALGFAGLENALYLLNSPDWLGLGTMRGVLSIPAHVVFGAVMGLFAARAYRGRWPALNWTLALLVPILGHGLYDFPLMMWNELTYVPFNNPTQVWREMFWLLMAVLIVSGAATFYICRREMVEIFSQKEDADIHRRDGSAVASSGYCSSCQRGGRPVGRGSCSRTNIARLLLAPSIFRMFGWIMRLHRNGAWPAAHRRALNGNRRRLDCNARTGAQLWFGKPHRKLRVGNAQAGRLAGPVRAQFAAHPSAARLLAAPARQAWRAAAAARRHRARPDQGPAAEHYDR
jgi:hypothetical protein